MRSSSQIISSSLRWESLWLHWGSPSPQIWGLRTPLPNSVHLRASVKLAPTHHQSTDTAASTLLCPRPLHGTGTPNFSGDTYTKGPKADDCFIQQCLLSVHTETSAINFHCHSPWLWHRFLLPLLRGSCPQHVLDPHFFNMFSWVMDNFHQSLDTHSLFSKHMSQHKSYHACAVSHQTCPRVQALQKMFVALMLRE